MSGFAEDEDFTDVKPEIGVLATTSAPQEFWYLDGNSVEGIKVEENEDDFSYERVKQILHRSRPRLTMEERFDLINILTQEPQPQERPKTKYVRQRRPDLETIPPLPRQDISTQALQMIFSSLSIKDIFSCRFVCKEWRSPATMVLRKRVSKFFTIYSRDPTLMTQERGGPKKSKKSRIRPESDKLCEFLRVMKESQLLPISSFHLRFKHIGKPEHTPGIQSFFQLFGPIIQNLTLDFTHLKPIDENGQIMKPKSKKKDQMDQAPIHIQNYLGTVSLTNLRNLEFNFIPNSNFRCPSLSLGEQVRTEIMTTYFNAAAEAPVQHIRFISDKNLFELVESLENSPLNTNHLSRLTLQCSELVEQELENLGRVVNLKRLSLKANNISICPTVMNDFLGSQSKSLEYLKIFTYNENECRPDRSSTPDFVFQFPRMKNLKVFSIQNEEVIGWPCKQPRRPTYKIFRCKPIDWPEIFPKLQEFKMRGQTSKGFLSVLFSLRNKHQGVQIVDWIPGPNTKPGLSLETFVHKISGIFPNVHTLKTSILNLTDPRSKSDPRSKPDPLPKSKMSEFKHLKKFVLHGANRIYEWKDEERILALLNCNVKKSFWGMEWNENDSRIQFYCEHLTDMALEIKFSHTKTDYFGMTRKTSDCGWLLKLFHERKELEDLNKVKDSQRSLNLVTDSEDLEADSEDTESESEDLKSDSE